MTNREKFKKVFGFDYERLGFGLCDDIPDCKNCHYYDLPFDRCKNSMKNFWNEEYKESITNLWTRVGKGTFNDTRKR